MTLIEIFSTNDFPRLNGSEKPCVEENFNKVDQIGGESSDKIFFDDNNCRSYVESCEKTAQDPQKTDFDWVFKNLDPINQLKLK